MDCPIDSRKFKVWRRQAQCKDRVRLLRPGGCRKHTYRERSPHVISHAFKFITSSHVQQKTAGPPPCRFAILHSCSDYFLLTDFLSSAPGLNFATLRAAILI